LHVLGTLQGGVTISPAGVLSGTGQLGGDVEIQGALMVTANDDPLTITGSLILGADSRLTIDAGYQQTRGTSLVFELLTASGITGQFENQAGTGVEAHLGNGYFLSQINHTSNRIELEILSALPGDANGDGLVDGVDFNIWNQFRFLSGTDWVGGDFNGDGLTDGTDFGLWNAHKFTSSGTAATWPLVPEPAAGWACMLWAMVCLSRARQRAAGWVQTDRTGTGTNSTDLR
jgi:hypothetical protein